MRGGMIVALLIVLAMVCAGCKDRAEINDIAMVMASSIDLKDDGRYVGMIQVAVPARQIGNVSQGRNNYFIETGTGKNAQEVMEQLQGKLSRRLFISHRRVLLIGEKLARKGIKEIMDHFSRNPKTRLRTYVLVVKEQKGSEALKVDYPLEFFPTEAVREMEVLLGRTAVTLRDLLNTASGEGIEPVMGAIELVPGQQIGSEKSKNKLTFKLNHSAIFKNLKLVGYLNNYDSQLMLWVTGKLKRGVMTLQLPEHKGNVGVTLHSTSREIVPEVKGGKVSFTVHLKGTGTLDENNTHLDFSNPNYYYLVEDTLMRVVRKDTQKMIASVQKKYAADIFGFGDQLHKKNNKEWQKLKLKWDKKFAKAVVTVDVDFVLKRAGMSGPPVHLREQEIVK
ncbi:Ger(x)C family spore germination protein [Paenibacillus harenae]|uniref:Ger(x)C family spore germination protein n=1 Tax=Paenibacillus harenae TaxID=306543 RepID=UPI00042101DA|nr:Ger(x)C family spore germination protein [Paenibacillus harenae]